MSNAFAVTYHNDLIVHDVLFHEPITEDVDDMELWWQTWLVTSVSSGTWPVRTAHCH